MIHSNLLRLLVLLALAPPEAAAQDMPRVRRTIEALTARRLHGRGYVRHGEQRAAAYLRQRFCQLGLQPLAPDYTQPFRLDVNTFPGPLKLRAVSNCAFGPAHRYRAGFEFIAEPESGGGEVGGRPLLFDTLAFTEAAARRQWLTPPPAPYIVVLTAAALARLQALPPTDSLRRPLDAAAARITVVKKLTASLAAQPVPQVRLQLLGQELPLWWHYISLKVETELKRQYPTQNLVGYVPGRVQPDSFLVVTAHYDHLGTMGHRAYFPGANDNASGTAMLLELAAHYARPENRPAYSVVFVAFGAEEAGLVGSTYFVEHPLVPLGRIRFLLNLDLLGTGSEGATVVNGRVFPAQFQQLQRLNDTRHALPSLAARGRAANSDHFPFSERGVPAFFLYTRGGITAYHDVHDRAATLPLTAFSSVFGLLRAFLDELGAAAR